MPLQQKAQKAALHAQHARAGQAHLMHLALGLLAFHNVERWVSVVSKLSKCSGSRMSPEGLYIKGFVPRVVFLGGMWSLSCGAK